MCQTLVLASEYCIGSIYSSQLLDYSAIRSLFLLQFSKHFLKISFLVHRTAPQH